MHYPLDKPATVKWLTDDWRTMRRATRGFDTLEEALPFICRSLTPFEARSVFVAMEMMPAFGIGRAEALFADGAGLR